MGGGIVENTDEVAECGEKLVTEFTNKITT
jgi:hypothetical protein